MALSKTHVPWSPGPASWKDDLTPLAPSEWNEDRAAHLLAHAGFGGAPEEIRQLAAGGLDQAVRSLVHYEGTPNPRMQPFEVGPERLLVDRRHQDRPSRSSVC